MRIALDLDGVVFDFAKQFTDLYATWFGEGEPEVTGWDISAGTHFEDMREALTWFDRADGYNSMEFIAGAPGGIDSLLEAGHSLVFATARSKVGKATTEYWFRSSPWAKTGVQLQFPGHSKWNVPASLYVDDSPDVLAGLAERGKDYIRFEQPWNMECSGPVAANWSDLLSQIEDIS